MSTDRKSCQVADEVLAQSVGETMVLFHPGTERILSLNASGSRIWELLSEGTSSEEIVARMLEEFDAPEPLIREQVGEFLAELEAEQVIQRSP